jgi:hypothetical protein
MAAHPSLHLYNSNLSYLIQTNKLYPLQIHHTTNNLSDMNRSFESMNLSKNSTFRHIQQRQQTTRVLTCPSPPRATNNTSYCWSHIHFTQ